MSTIPVDILPAPSAAAAAATQDLVRESNSRRVASMSSAELVADNDVTDRDILTSRHAHRNPRQHPGTKQYEALINTHAFNYGTSDRKGKTAISLALTNEIHADGCRFLVWNPGSKGAILDPDGNPIEQWRVLTPKRAREKVAVAMKNVMRKLKRRIERDRTAPSHHPAAAAAAAAAAQISKHDESIPGFSELLRVQQDILSGNVPQTDSSKRETEFDVFCGRGSCANTTIPVGKRLFIALVKANCHQYRNSVDHERKKLIVNSIYFAVRFVAGGRFLILRDPESKNWIEQDRNETLKKIAQACRDATHKEQHYQNKISLRSLKQDEIPWDSHGSGADENETVVEGTKAFSPTSFPDAAFCDHLRRYCSRIGCGTLVNQAVVSCSEGEDNDNGEDEDEDDNTATNDGLALSKHGSDSSKNKINNNNKYNNNTDSRLPQRSELITDDILQHDEHGTCDNSILPFTWH